MCNIDGNAILLILLLYIDIYGKYKRRTQMIKVKEKNAITLIALVITIVIMLLLAAIVIQMAIGENGLVVKTIQAKKEQAKAELYSTVKQSYTRLSLQAIEKKMPNPDVGEVFKTDEFKEKYNVVGDNITDKKGEIIDTKELVLNSLRTDYVVRDEESDHTAWPKNVGGIEIQEEDKDKLIVKIRVKDTKAKIEFGGESKIDYGDGVVRNVSQERKEFNTGEYVVKIWGYSNAYITNMNER